jgi:hypothetical protein
LISRGPQLARTPIAEVEWTQTAIDISAAEQDLDELRTSLTGRVVVGTDDDYDALRACFNGMIDRRPLAIARVTDERDVAAAIAFARQHDLPLAVRSGGHSSPGHGVCDDGIVIDVRELKQVAVDPDRRIVTLGLVRRNRRLARARPIGPFTYCRCGQIRPRTRCTGSGLAMSPRGSPAARWSPSPTSWRSTMPSTRVIPSPQP